MGAHVGDLAVRKDDDLVRVLTDEMRWAMMNLVVPLSVASKASRMRRSVAVSTALVESSRMRMGGFLSRARAMHSRCFCPPETLTPPCSIQVS